MKTQNGRAVLMLAMWMVAIVCFAAASLIYAVSSDDPYFYTEAELRTHTRAALVQSYVLASGGVALLIGVARMLKRESKPQGK